VTPSSEFGDCPCGGEFETRIVEVRLQADGEEVLLEDVPQGACPECGSRVYKAGVLEVIEAVMGKRTIRPLIRVR
jgi:YgiT-type zinc finger domain-containing protein